jgi:hypothetical protein
MICPFSSAVANFKPLGENARQLRFVECATYLEIQIDDFSDSVVLSIEGISMTTTPPPTDPNSSVLPFDIMPSSEGCLCGIDLL